MIKKLSYTLLTLGMLLGILYGLTPLLASKVIEQQLQALGLENKTTLEYPTHNQVTIRHLALNSRSGLKFKAQLKNIKINYDFYHLIFKQQIKSIDITKLEIDLFKLSSNTAERQQPLNLHHLISQQWFSALPVDQLTIDDLNFHWQLQPEQSISVKGNATLNKELLAVTFYYFENHKQYASGRIELSADNRVNISATTTAPGLTYHLKAAVKAVENTQQIQISLTQQLSANNFMLDSLWLKAAVNDQHRDFLADTSAALSLQSDLTFSSSFNDVASWLKTLSINNQLETTFEKQQFNYPAAHFKASAKRAIVSLSAAISWREQRLNLTLLKNSLFNVKQLSISAPKTIDQSNSARAVAAKNTSNLGSLAGTKINILGIEINLASDLRSTWYQPFDSPWTGLEIENFAVSIASEIIQTDNALIEHQPITLEFSVMDEKSLALSMAYYVPALSFSKSSSAVLDDPFETPFASVHTVLKGSAVIENKHLRFLLVKNTPLSFTDIRTSQATAPNLKFVTQSALSVSMPIGESAGPIKISDTAFLALPSQWLSPVGQINTQDTAFNLENINIANQSASIRFAVEKMTLHSKPETKSPFKLTPLPFEHAEIKVTGLLDLSPKDIKLSLDKGAKVRLKHLKTPWLYSRQVNIKSGNKLRIRADRASPDKVFDLSQVKISPIGFTLTSSPLTIGNQEIQFQYLSTRLKQLTFRPLAWSLSTELKKLNVPSQPMQEKYLKNINISATHQGRGSSYRGDFNISSKESPINIKAAVKSVNQFKAIKANWQLSPINLAKQATFIKPFFANSWPQALQIVSGKYRQSAEIKIADNKISATVDHHITDLSLIKEKASIDTVNINSQSRYVDDQLTHSGSIKITAINTAIAVNNLSAQFSLANLLKQNRSLTVSNLRAEVLDADLHLKRLSTPLDYLEGSATIIFNNLPLHNVLALENQPSLTAKGHLQGQLPFKFKGAKLWVIDGKVNNKTRGYIRYRPSRQVRDVTKTNTGLDMALSALENFHYNTLSIKANYTPDGKLILENKLVGNNPQWQQGHPIEFSINIEENMLKLFKALKISQNLTKNIEKKLQKSTRASRALP